MNYSFLMNSSLFRGITEDELKDMLKCLDASTTVFEKGSYIYRCGQVVDRIGIVLSGSVMIENDDLWGNRSILAHIEPGQIFAETYACTTGEALLVNVVSVERTEVLFIHTAKILQICPHACPFHHALIRNLMQISAQKSLQLSRRILYTSPKSIRGRLMTYFSDRVKQTGSYTITVPFNRQQLADFLGVDRSSMCNELSKMQRDGLLAYEKNTFRIKENL